MKFFLILEFLLIHCFVASGQTEMKFKRITTQSGENITGIQSIYKDSEGYVWMGSAGFDLIRLDGRNKKKYTYPKESVEEDNKTTRAKLIFEDSKKNLWIGTVQGVLMHYNRPLDKFESIKDSVSTIKYTMSCYAEDNDGSFWLGTMGGGLLRYHPITKKFTRYQSSKNDTTTLSYQYVTALAFDSTGKLWIATTNGLCSYDSATNRFIRYRLTNGNPTDTYRYRVIRSMLLSKNNLYISTYGGLQIFNINTLQSEHFVHQEQDTNSLGVNSLFQATENPDGSIWFASYGGGLIHFDPRSRRFTSVKSDEYDPESIATNNLFFVYLDQEGLLWVGADDNTVYVHNTKAKKFHSMVHKPSKPDGISSGFVSSIFQENDSIFWLGLNGNGLNRLNLISGVAKKFINSPSDQFSLGHNAVKGIDQDHEKRIWVGLGGGGINMLDDKTGHFIRHETGGKNSINNNAVSAMLIDQNDFIWVTTFISGLNIYNIKPNKFIKINDDSLLKATGISFASTKNIFEQNGNIWFNTKNQIVLFDKTRNQFVKIAQEGELMSTSATPFFFEIRPFTEKEMLLVTKSEVVSILYSDPEHIVKKPLLKLNSEEGLQSFVLDRNNQIWYATKNYLVKWNPKTDEKKKYNQSDGVSTNLISLYVDKQGRIFVLTINGITWFDPDEILDDTVHRKIHFSDFQLYNRSVGVCEKDSTTNFSLSAHISHLNKLTLDHHHSFFSIEFMAEEYIAPEKIQYAYKLDGFDKAWVYVGNRNFASYTNLDPGKYTFQVKCANPDGFYGHPISISISINPPFWRTWWFMLIAFLLMSSALYALYRYRVSQLLRVERLRTKIASDLHDEVGSSLTKISIYSDLLQAGNNESNNSAYLIRISSMSREIIGTMGDIIWSIDNQSDMAGALFLRMKDFATELLQSKNIQVDFKITDINEKAIIDPVLKQAIYLIFKESINNVVKHAAANHVTIELQNQGNRFQMAISDDGKGFVAEQNSKGNGLKSMKRRALAAEGKLTITHQQGTQVVFTRKSF